jgi:2,3-bisphosphoglycerate-independent phosphoglycerate mutase
MSDVKRPRPVVLCVLDGWGFRDDAQDNAVTRAQKPVFDKYWAKSPHSLLDASEEHVGLPKGQIGNSEVGHMNLGAGRVIFQDLPMIDREILQDNLKNNETLNDLIAKLKKSGGTCHVMGLASPGGVHAHQDHLVALVREISKAGIPACVHAFLDGRDVPPKSAAEQIAKLAADLRSVDVRTVGKVKLATLCGRYYAMDRDKRWERVEQAYELLVSGTGAAAEDAVEAIKDSYAANIADEFVLPVNLQGYAGMKNGDGILFINFRADRAREILTALIDPDFKGFMRKKTIRFAAVAGMVEYSDELNKHMQALFPPKVIRQGMGEIVAAAGLKQLRIAETEKYPHVTFFFNGGREEPYAGEERIVVPSPKVATYDLQPEMSAAAVTDKVVAAIDSAQFDFIVLNYANPDMVGHTGFLDAAITAVETIDGCLGRLFEAVEKQGGIVFVTADHGNCEHMFDHETNGPHTAHTLERVPAMLVGAPEDVKALKDGQLADVAPTFLELMGIDKPDVMDGRSLLVR